MFEEELVEKGRSYNIFNEDIDDSVLVKQYKLDPKLAYNPKINSAIVNSQYGMTMNTLMSQGVSELKAKKIASAERSKANQRISRALKTRRSENK